METHRVIAMVKTIHRRMSVFQSGGLYEIVSLFVLGVGKHLGIIIEMGHFLKMSFSQIVACCFITIARTSVRGFNNPFSLSVVISSMQCFLFIAVKVI